jgi:16S rRNA (cytidine1402-2'-O)-methyltransferase
MTLYVLPNVFSDEQEPHLLLPEGLSTILLSLTGLIAESERTGRRYLIKLLKDPLARTLPIYLLNEHSSSQDRKNLAEKVLSGEVLGLISDAGTPCIADPGSELVHLLRKRGEKKIIVIPGPCSILLALISSGLPGQSFSFHGYLPKEKEERYRKIRLLEYQSEKENSTQIFIETPYRNEALLQDLLATLKSTTELALVSSITFPDENVRLHTVEQWKKSTPTVEKTPTIFLFHGGSK